MNLTSLYSKRIVLARDITVGMQLKIGECIKPEETFSIIPMNTIGTVTEVGYCAHVSCDALDRSNCNRHLISVKVDYNDFAHSCYYKFNTLDNIPVVFEEEQI
jgi:hypothetical protein